MLLALAAALALAACDNDLNITGPRFPESPRLQVPGQNIWVTGTLTPEDGYCYEAILRYDGQEIAHDFCRAGGDCDEMELSGLAPEGGGHHTVELHVLRQEPPGSELLYTAAVVLRGDPLDSPISLGPTRQVLRAGDSLVFELDLP